jgi:hypothetical protein
MASKRASSRSPSPSLCSTQSPPRRSSRRAKTAPGILASHRVFILQAKLSDADISEIYELAENADADVVGSPEDAEIIITAIGMRKRLERHLDWNLAVSVYLSLFRSHSFDQVIMITEKKSFSNARLAARVCCAGPPAPVRRPRSAFRIKGDD